MQRAPYFGSGEPAWVRRSLIAVALAFLGLVLVLPLALVFTYAFAEGIRGYLGAFADADTRAALRLTLLTAAIAVPVNTLFGIAAAWAIARFDFPGRNLLVTLIDLPFAISPVVAGMIFVLLAGSRGLVGPWLMEHDIRILFAVPGIVLATMFVTLPFVARELIPLMQAQGSEEEQAALTLGASGWQTFRRITLPNIKWALIYGVILCNARAMGEFGAVSVVSGHIRGRTNTIPLHIEVLFNDYETTASFAVATLLTFLAFATLIVKAIVERSTEERRSVADAEPVGSFDDDALAAAGRPTEVIA